MEDVLEVYNQEGCSGAIVQYGGQTPLNLASQLKSHGVNIIGISESIDTAEDRELFKWILDEVGPKQPENLTALNEAEAYEMAEQVGSRFSCGPLFSVAEACLLFIAWTTPRRYPKAGSPGKPVLLDKFLEDAIELDVDCISDGETTLIGGMLEHIEFAGVHSGDAAMVLPPHTLGDEMIETVRQASYRLAKALSVVGLMNIQFAIKDDQLYVLEVNPRASRTVPFVSKAIGVPLAKLAAKLMTGKTLPELGFTEEMTPKHWCIKESVFPFVRFPAPLFARSRNAFNGSQIPTSGSHSPKLKRPQSSLPTEGNVFLSVKDRISPRLWNSQRISLH